MDLSKATDDLEWYYNPSKNITGQAAERFIAQMVTTDVRAKGMVFWIGFAERKGYATLRRRPWCWHRGLLREIMVEYRLVFGDRVEYQPSQNGFD